MDKRLTRKAKPVRPPKAASVRPRKAGAPPVRVKGPQGASGSGAGPDEEGGASGKTRILAVDDTAGDLRDLRNALKATHAEVFTCSNGKAAIEFLKGDPVDLVVLDVLMPEMDGYEVCRAIKHDPRTKDVPVIFVSGNIQSEDFDKGMDVGAWDYISKPINPMEVANRVNNALEMKQARDKLKVATIVPEEQVREQLALQQKMADFQMAMMTTHWHKRFGQLSANFAEEMKTPLASALGNIRMMMVDDQIESRHRDKLAMVYSHFRKVEEMLKRLLNVAERVPHPQIVTVASTVNDAIQLLNLEIQYYQIKLVVQLDPTAQWVGMPSELGRAVLYLLHNAIESVTYRPRIYPEFTNDEEAEPVDMVQPKNMEPEIRVVVEQDEGQIDIHVMDNGAGIPPEQMEQVFEPYFTTKSAPHMGAGLHLARSVARAGGGELVAFSPNNDGLTQFTIAIPLFDPSTYEEDFTEVEIDPGAETVTDLEGAMEDEQAGDEGGETPA